MSLSSYFPSRIEFESCLRSFYEETKSCPYESGEWTWEIQSIVKTFADVI